MATKTTIDVFKQHDPQRVADLSDVAGAPPRQKWRLQTQKMHHFLVSLTQNDVITRSRMAEISVRSTIWNLWYKKKFLIFQVCLYYYYSWNEKVLPKNYKSVFNWIFPSYSKNVTKKKDARFYRCFTLRTNKKYNKMLPKYGFRNLNRLLYFRRIFQRQ